MDLRLAFNEDVKQYDRYRPTYPTELHQEIIAYAGLRRGGRVLEIGCGTGQATLPFLEAGCDVTAVELGNRLAAFAQNKFSKYQNFHLIQSDFLTCELAAQAYDLVYSATAFHWIPKSEGYCKIKSLLKPRGAVALFWNHPYVNRLDDASNRANRRIYEKYRPYDDPPAEFSETDCQNRLEELRQYGFVDRAAKLYRRTRSLSSDAYIGLLNTYSDHRALPKQIRLSFETDVKQAIDRAGGTIHIYDTIDLYLAAKPM